MRILFVSLVLLCISFCSCTKDGTTTDASNHDNSVGTGGSLARFTIVGSYLYIANVSDIRVYDISNNGSPVEKTPVYTGWGIETIFAYNNNLFLGSSSGMFIYSLADPANPKLTGQAQHFRSCDPVVANDSFAFVTLRGGTACGPATDGLYTYTILDLTKPVLISTLEMSTPSGLGLNGNIVYVSRKTNGLSVVDITNTAKPIIRKTLEDAGFEDVIVFGNLLICYVHTGIRLYDITTPDNPVYINTVANQ